MDDGDEPSSSQSIEEEIIQHDLSDSDSASCNSISNPFYDGPRTEAASAPHSHRRAGGDAHLPSPGPSTPEGANQAPIKNNEMVVIAFAPGYFRTCVGFLRLLQFVSCILHGSVAFCIIHIFNFIAKEIKRYFYTVLD